MPAATLHRDDLVAYLGQTLDINRFRDYCPNGLQVEGRAEIRKIVSGVTASLALLEAAVEEGADAVLVHHGYFWRGEDARIVGMRKKRLALLLKHDLNLLAYHLPLDAHPELGNNAQLAEKLGLVGEGRFGDDGLGWIGSVAAGGPRTVGEFAAQAEARLGRAPTLVGDPAMPLARIAWCTGAAQGMIEGAIGAGAALYISGEISEPTAHAARESGTAYLACGHHATERFGVQALGTHVAERFGIEHRFIDIPNPA